MSITNIATVASGIIELIGTGKEVYKATVNAMDAIEAKGVVKVPEHDILVPGYNCSRLSIK